MNKPNRKWMWLGGGGGGGGGGRRTTLTATVSIKGGHMLVRSCM